MNKLLLQSYTEGKVTIAFHMEQHVMRVGEFTVSVSHMCRAAVFIIKVFVVGCGHKPCVWRLLMIKAGVLKLLGPD